MFTRTLITSLLAFVVCGTDMFGESPDAAAQKRKEAYWRRVGYPTTVAKYLRAAGRVDLRKPIGEYEAYVLANAYFLMHFGWCGGADLPNDRGDRWVAETHEGYGGTPGDRITIDKKTGATYAPRRPRVTDPKEYLRYAKNI
jgi:hypothetical protein